MGNRGVSNRMGCIEGKEPWQSRQGSMTERHSHLLRAQQTEAARSRAFCSASKAAVCPVPDVLDFDLGLQSAGLGARGPQKSMGARAGDRSAQGSVPFRFVRT